METKYFNSEGHLDDNYIGFFVEKTMEKKASDIDVEIKEHIEKCSICKKNALELMNMLIFFENEKKIERIFSMEEAVTTRQKLTKKPMLNYLMRAAAAITILFTIGLLSFYLVNNPTTKANLIGEEYKENVQLEQELNYNTRNEETISISIITPGKDEVFDTKDEITIQWECDENGATFDIGIFDNKNNELALATQIVGYKYKIPMQLKRGLYYYRLYTNTLQLTGKFYVE